MKLQCFLSGTHLKAPGSLRQPPHVGLTLHTSSDGLIVESSRILFQGFPSGSEAKNPPATAGDMGLIPGLGGSPGEGNGKPLQYSCLENSMARGDW